jgi:hypothetical protein
MIQRIRTWLGGRAFRSRVVAKLSGRKHVLCLGDSHTRILSDVSVPGFWFRVVYVRGATASGIQNPNSATNARSVFKAAIDSAKPWQHALVNLGEVDCNFIIWRRALKYETSVEAQLAVTLASYAQFLDEVAEVGFASMTVLSATLPTIEDYATLKERFPNFDPEVMGFRTQIRVSYEDRLRVTNEFNAGLAERCADIGADFIDTTSRQLDPDTNRVRAGLVVPDTPNIHLHGPGYAALLESAFAEPGHFGRLTRGP